MTWWKLVLTETTLLTCLYLPYMGRNLEKEMYMLACAHDHVTAYLYTHAPNHYVYVHLNVIKWLSMYTHTLQRLHFQLQSEQESKASPQAPTTIHPMNTRLKLKVLLTQHPNSWEVTTADSKYVNRIPQSNGPHNEPLEAYNHTYTTSRRETLRYFMLIPAPDDVRGHENGARWGISEHPLLKQLKSFLIQNQMNNRSLLKTTTDWLMLLESVEFWRIVSLMPGQVACILPVWHIHLYDRTSLSTTPKLTTHI